MENELIKLAATQGIWTALSVALIFYILKAQEKRDSTQKEREENYQNMLLKLTDEFSIVEDVKKDIGEIKDYIFKNKTLN